MKNDYLLGTERVSKALLTLGVPAIIAMIVNALHNVIDTIYIGRFVGASGIAATAVFLPVMMIVMALATMIGIGSGSLVSRLLGMKNMDKVNLAVGNMIVVTGLSSALFAISGILFNGQIMELFGAKGGVYQPAVEYAGAMFYSIFTFPFCVAANNIIRAEGNAKNAMYSMLSGIVTNIILDYLLIVRLGMGMRGAGIATTIANTVSFGYVIWYFIVKSSISPRLRHLMPDVPILKEIMAVGSSAFTIQASAGLVTLVLNHTLYKYGGETALSVYGIVFKLIIFYMMPLHGLVQGMQPIVGYSRGAGNHARVRKTVLVTLTYAIAFSTMTCLFVLIFPEYAIRLFTNDEALISSGRNAVRIVLSASPVIGIYITGMTFFQSIGDARMSLFISVLRQPVLFVPALMLLPGVFGLGMRGIWMSFPVSDFLATAVTLILLLKINNKRQSATDSLKI